MISIKEVQSISRQNSEIARETKKCLVSIEKDIIKAAQRGEFSVISVLPNTVRGKSYTSQVLETITLELKVQGYVVSLKNTPELGISWSTPAPDSFEQKSVKEEKTTKGIPDIKSFDDLLKDSTFLKSLDVLHITPQHVQDLQKQFKDIFKQ